MSESQFRAAVRQLEAGLRCKKCGAMNRPGATLIEWETEDRAVCGVCSHAFDPREGATFQIGDSDRHGW